MSEELTITKKRVLEAAGKCPEVKETLKVLFPSAFEAEYCCDTLRHCIEEKDIRKSGPEFVFGKASWFINHCPFCKAKLRTE